MDINEIKSMRVHPILADIIENDDVYYILYNFENNALVFNMCGDIANTLLFEKPHIINHHNINFGLDDIKYIKQYFGVDFDVMCQCVMDNIKKLSYKVERLTFREFKNIIDGRNLSH